MGAPPANLATGTDSRTPGLAVNVSGVRVVVATVGVALLGLRLRGAAVVAILVGVASAVQSRGTLALVVLVAV